ncbi:MAG TPA: DUF4476 domain-containing protein [Bacteroidales bacterium]|nr:DUF4476 domain-containing protein [Bacteroidales bacterium]
MKKLLLLGLFLAAFVCKISAQSNVTVFSQEGEKFWVIVNGIKQNEAAQTNVKITGLTEPNYKLKVIFENNNLPPIDKAIFTKDADGNSLSTSYEVKKDKKGNYVLRLASYDETPVVTEQQFTAPLVLVERPSTQVNEVNTHQTQTTTTVVSGNTQAEGGSISINAVDPVTGEAINMNVSVNAGVTGPAGNVTSTTTTMTTTTTTTSTSGNVNAQPADRPSNEHYIMQGYNGPMGCPWPMSDADFQSVKGSITSKDFEDSKLAIAKQVLGSNCMLCSQVRDIMQLFTFEATRLDFAKFAYSRVFDQGNYYKLNDAFTFESSIDELNAFINKR